MDNKTIYKKTLGFSIRSVLWDILTLVIIGAAATGGFILADKLFRMGLIGLIVGAVIGIIATVIILRFVSYSLKAGQIAMMTKAITEGELPENVIAEGKKAVKERFATVAAYFAVTNVIKGIFNQIGRVITNVGQNIGGDTGSAVGSTISTVIQVIVSYLCDCCLGWVFFRKDVNAAKATCEGAVLFFKHGKTFAKNMGRIFGIGIASLLGIGGAFSGLFYAILRSQEASLAPIYNSVSAAMANSEGKLAAILQDPKTLPIVFAIIGGVIIWGIIHSTFIRPFILAGVLKNYLETGMNNIPSEDSFSILDSKSEKFKKLHNGL